MEAAATLDNSDIEKLNDRDKAELRQFVTNEQQRTRIQSLTHGLTDICWKKCITSAVRNGKLERAEEGCLANCVDRFFDVNLLTMKHLNSLRQQ